MDTTKDISSVLHVDFKAMKSVILPVKEVFEQEIPEKKLHEHRERSRIIETLYKNHWGDLCRRLRKIFGEGPPEIEDLAQTAFTKVVEIDDLNRIRHPRAFLFRTATNLGFNAIKHIKTARNFIEQELRDAGEPLTENSNLENIFAEKERLNVIISAVDKLSAKQKDVLIRSRIYGETYARITLETGWSQADISRQLSAALEALQKTLRYAETDNQRKD